MQKSKENSTLGDLRRAASCLQAVLLSFLHSRVTGQQAGSLQGRTVAVLNLEQRTGDAVTDRAGLAGHAAAGHGGCDVELAQGIGRREGLTNDELQGLETKVVIQRTAVDGDAAAGGTF